METESRLVVAVFEESRRCPGVSSALLGTGGECGARERVDGSLSKGRQGGGDGWSYGLSLVQIRHQPPHLLQSLSLHEDVVLGQEEGGYFGEFSHRGAVGVGDNRAQAVQRVVQVVHPPPLPGVDAEPQGALLLGLLGERAPGLVVPKRRAPLPGLQRVEAVLVVARVLPAALVGLGGLAGEEVGGRREREASGASSTMASSEPEGWLAVALRQVEERVVADGLEQVLFADIHFLSSRADLSDQEKSTLPLLCSSLSYLLFCFVFLFCFGFFFLFFFWWKTGGCTHVAVSESCCCFLGSPSLPSLLFPLSAQWLFKKRRLCESEAEPLHAFTSSVHCAPPCCAHSPRPPDTSV